ncbi:MAG: hypothetical protein ACRENJ_05375, partial [Candidatus Eiseniibacteriota bacterium]
MTSTPASAFLVLVASLAIVPPARSDWPPSGLGVCTEAHHQFAPVPAPDGAGGAFIAWRDGREPPGIYVQRVTSSGDIAAGWPADGRFLWRPHLGLLGPWVTADGSGGLYLAWWGGFAVFAQRITAAGEIAPGWPEGAMFLATAGTGSGWGGERALVVPDGAGGAIVAWSDPGIQNIGVQRITAGGALPAGWSPGGVTVSPTPIGYATMALA